jgi:hypothetical protein
MSKAILLLFVVLSAWFLLRKSRNTSSRRSYERKPQTPWAALNEDQDPTL